MPRRRTTEAPTQPTSAYVRSHACRRRDFRIRGDRARPTSAGEIQLELLQRRPDVHRVRRTQPIGEQHAVQMIRFVLHDASLQPIQLQTQLVAAQRVGLQTHRRGTPYRGKQPGETQAAFLAFGQSLGTAQHRIDEHHLFPLAANAGQVADEQP